MNFFCMARTYNVGITCYFLRMTFVKQLFQSDIRNIHLHQKFPLPSVCNSISFCIVEKANQRDVSSDYLVAQRTASAECPLPLVTNLFEMIIVKTFKKLPPPPPTCPIVWILPFKKWKHGLQNENGNFSRLLIGLLVTALRSSFQFQQIQSS